MVQEQSVYNDYAARDPPAQKVYGNNLPKRGVILARHRFQRAPALDVLEGITTLFILPSLFLPYVTIARRTK